MGDLALRNVQVKLRGLPGNEWPITLKIINHPQNQGLAGELIQVEGDWRDGTTPVAVCHLGLDPFPTEDTLGQLTKLARGL